MRYNTILKMSYLPIAALLFSGASFAAAPVVSAIGPPIPIQAEDMRSASEASKLLDEVRLMAHDLKREARILESFNWNRVSPETHASQLMLAREHINAISERIERLRAIQPDATAWQQQAIESIVPVAAHLADRTEAAIEHLNEYRNRRFVLEYADHLRAISDRATELKASVSDHLDLAQTENRAVEIRSRISDARS